VPPKTTPVKSLLNNENIDSLSENIESPPRNRKEEDENE
jgi:hypothetical protein